MGTLVFVCPATGEEVSTGIEMDLATLSQLDVAKVYCPLCRQPHQMVGIEYWLSQVDEPTPRRRSITICGNRSSGDCADGGGRPLQHS